MKYKDLYDEDILELFGEHRESIENLELNGFEVDLNAILDILGIETKTTFNKEYNNYDFKNKLIYVTEGNSLQFRKIEVANALSIYLLKIYDFRKLVNSFQLSYVADKLLLPNKLLEKGVREFYNSNKHLIDYYKFKYKTNNTDEILDFILDKAIIVDVTLDSILVLPKEMVKYRTLVYLKDRENLVKNEILKLRNG